MLRFYPQVFYKLLLITTTFLFAGNIFAQKPNITYTTPLTFTAGKAVKLIPVNTGGSIPASQFGKVSTFAGNGQYGTVNGKGTAASFASPSGIAVDSLGNLYVSDRNIPNNAGKHAFIRKITPGGVVSTYAGNGTDGSADGPAASASFNNPAGLAADINRNIYVVEPFGGTYSNGLVRKISAGGVVTTVAGGGAPGIRINAQDGQGTSASLSVPVGITLDNAGNIYLTTQNKIRKINTSQYVSTFAGDGSPGFIDGYGTTARFNQPIGIVADNSGNLFIADYYNLRLRKITPDSLVSTEAGYGAIGNNDGPGTTASFNNLSGLAIDGVGNKYVLDGNGSLRKVSPGGVVTTIVKGLSGATITYYHGSIYFPGINTIMRVDVTGSYTIQGPSLPDGLVFDPNTGIISGTPNVPGGPQTFYITASNSYGSSTASVTIDVKLPPAPKYMKPPKIAYNNVPAYFVTSTPIIPLAPKNTGGVVPQTTYGSTSIIAGGGPPTISFDAIGTKASFIYPLNLATDASGNIYVTDRSKVRRISPNAVVTTLDMNGKFTSNPPPGLASAALFPGINGVALDGAGNIYISENLYSTIQKVSHSGMIGPFAGTTISGSKQKDGTGNAAAFSHPGGMVVSKTGDLYVTDVASIRKITPAGVVTTFAGNLTDNAGVSFKAGHPPDGVGSHAFFELPQGMAMDTAENLFVTDLNAHNIRKITKDSVVSTVVSGLINPSYGIGVDIKDNLYYSANYPVYPNTGPVTTTGQTIDRDGNLIIADVNTQTISKMILTGYTIDSVLPAGLTFDGKTGIISGTPTTPAPAKAYIVTAYNAGGNSSYVIHITVASNAAPTITSITPAAAITDGTIVINGNNFTAATNVTFGDTPAKSFVISSPTVITAVVDNGSTGNVSVKTPFGTGTFGGFIFVPLPAITANGPVTFLSTGSVVLTASPATGYNYQWSNGGTVIAGATASTYIAKQSGAYTVTITANGVSQTSAVVNVKSVFTLPANNFSVSATSATCIGNNDGSVNITAVQSMAYTATITGNGLSTPYPFTTSTAINNIAAGSYHVCITVAGQPDYAQCYDVVITEPKNLSVYSVINSDNSLTLGLSGGSRYNIILNGTAYATSSNSITLPLGEGTNDLTVTTDRLCQGSFKRFINISGKIIPYPMPFQNSLNLNVGNTMVNNVSIEIHNVGDGKLVYTKQYINQSGVIQLDLTGLQGGVYALHLSTDSSDKIFKIIKK
ncbi:putative Ig domain-containing protein [Mucilaginibacter xinganensis]|uniref:Secretion system C-terminal sorting domain-containing protein n=1 Tax=Mucilaginibacter xinganensis TaxID=1234841 RepID=A0A223NX12_9SPHI|nr:putative Ig domain-containing protein [Mucilaginibacter xinganensis]ASU34330.1 hypothetical protein MuYL_2443 [Mucilaginibacter xinganensis]